MKEFYGRSEVKKSGGGAGAWNLLGSMANKSGAAAKPSIFARAAAMKKVEPAPAADEENAIRADDTKEESISKLIDIGGTGTKVET